MSSITAALQYEDSNDGSGDISKSSDISFKGKIEELKKVRKQNNVSSSNFINLLDEMDEDGESAGSHIRPDDADSNPYWQLYDTVHNYTDNQGKPT